MTIIRGSGSTLRHIGSDGRECESDGGGIAGKGYSDAIGREARDAGVDRSGFRMMETDIAVERRARIGFQERTATGNIAQCGGKGRVCDQHAHAPATPGSRHSLRYGGMRRERMHCCHAYAPYMAN